MKAALTTPRRAVTDLLHASERLAELPAAGPADWLTHRTLAVLHELQAAAYAAALAGAPFEAMWQATVAARVFHARFSRVIAHAQRWPRGYPGDFEVIEALMDAKAVGRPGTIEHTLDACVLQLPIVWQHRAKVAWQAQLVRRRLADGAGARVLSIGCGGSRDLMLLEPHELARLTVVAVDIDDAALALSSERLGSRVRQLTCVRGNVLRLANRLRAAGPFDVIVIGGLLDYLPERAAKLLVARAIGMLAPDGVLGATNLSAGNPWRLLLQLIANWTIIERNGYEMAQLFAVPGVVVTELALDATGLTWLARVTRTPLRCNGYSASSLRHCDTAPFPGDDSGVSSSSES
jgi:SAM-dependent methyltransferase